MKRKLIKLSQDHFSEINPEKIRVKSFDSDDVFFKARFSIGRYLTFSKMRHLVFFNPRAFELRIEDKALDAILVHELAHVSYYTRKNRIQLLGLSCLLKSSREVQFERKADLVTIKKGFGDGLKLYREWLYRTIPDKSLASKKKFYLSPAEIDIAKLVLRKDPELFQRWQRKAPKNIEQMQRESGIE